MVSLTSLKSSPNMETPIMVDGFGAAVLESIRDPFSVVSPDYRILWANQTMAKAGRCPDEEAIGRICYDLLRGRSDPCPGCPMQEVLRSGRSYVSKKWEVSVNGATRWCKTRAYPVYGPDRQIRSVIMLVIDVTPKKGRPKTTFKSQPKPVPKSKTYLSKDLMRPQQPELTAREKEVLSLLVEGHSNVELSRILDISINTVKSHVAHIFDKLEVNDRTKAAVMATRNNLI